MTDHNQTPEQLARDNFDKMLDEAGWKVQQKSKIDLNVGPADYVLFVDKKSYRRYRSETSSNPWEVQLALYQ